jgi:hypothetical protein
MSEPLRDPGPDQRGHEQHEEPERADPDAPGPGLPPPTSIESLVTALIDAGPDVAEHVVRAAQELLLAAKVIVDAAETAIREQQDLRAQAADAEQESGSAGVRHLDVAE